MPTTIDDGDEDRDGMCTRTARIAHLNDNARLGHDHRARARFTRNCIESFCAAPGQDPATVQADLLEAFQRCEFAADSPERDFASILYRGRKVWMKIDYYDLRCERVSSEPADALITTRIITILLPEDC